MSLRQLVLSAALVGALSPLGGCEGRGGGCSDSADLTALRVVLDFTQVDGEYTVVVGWDGEEAVCRYSWPDAEGWQADCEGADHVLFWFEGETVWVSLEDLHPDSVDVEVSLDGASVFSQTLSPTYDVSGGERCGRDFLAREVVSF
jgi:hypothetical protein